MKLTNLKHIALAALFIFAGIGLETNAQLKIRWATNVRYIGGGYIDKRPQFNDLLSALNDVKAYATSDNPYVFWVDSDTLQIADWDSTYETGGLAMNDSIDVHYVATGKIKWAGFGQGGTGGGITSITPPQNYTTHYDLWTWTGQSGLGVWQDRLGENADSIDLKLWELIVYTDSVYLYVENDTLKIRTTAITALVTASGTRPDTTIIAYKAVNETITGNWTFDGEVIIGDGSLRLPSNNNKTGTSRIIWSEGNVPYWSGSGAGGDTSIVALLNPTTGTFRRDSVVAWPDLQDEVQDSINAWRDGGVSHVFLSDTTYAPDVTNGTPIHFAPGFDESEVDGMTFADDSLTVDADGTGSWYMSASMIVNAAVTDDYIIYFKVNGATRHTMTVSGVGAGDYAQWTSFHYEEDLSEGDTISMWIDNLIDNDDPTLTEVNFFFYRVHR